MTGSLDRDRRGRLLDALNDRLRRANVRASLYLVGGTGERNHPAALAHRPEPPAASALVAATAGWSARGLPAFEDGWWRTHGLPRSRNPPSPDSRRIFATVVSRDDGRSRPRPSARTPAGRSPGRSAASTSGSTAGRSRTPPSPRTSPSSTTRAGRRRSPRRRWPRRASGPASPASRAPPGERTARVLAGCRRTVGDRARRQAAAVRGGAPGRRPRHPPARARPPRRVRRRRPRARQPPPTGSQRGPLVDDEPHRSSSSTCPLPRRKRPTTGF